MIFDEKNILYRAQRGDAEAFSQLLHGRSSFPASMTLSKPNKFPCRSKISFNCALPRLMRDFTVPGGSPRARPIGELNDAAGADEYDAENYDAEGGGERQQFTLTSGDAKKSPDTENASSAPQGQDAGDSKLQSVPPVVLRDKDRCAAVRSWLEENGIEPTEEIGDEAAHGQAPGGLRE